MPSNGSRRSTSSSAETPQQSNPLAASADAWGETLLTLLTATLPGEHSVSIERRPPHFIVHTSSAGGQQLGHIPLRAKGQDRPVALLSISMSLRPDRSGKYLAVQRSALLLRDMDRRPLVRLEFDDQSHTRPSCHWQFHGQNDALAQLLAANRPKGKATRSLSHLHFPVGGARMRPAIEDFLQFLIQECGFAGKQGWKKAVEQSRSEWRVRQTKTIVRDAPGAAAAALADHLGVRVLRLARLGKKPDEVPGKFASW